MWAIVLAATRPLEANKQERLAFGGTSHEVREFTSESCLYSLPTPNVFKKLGMALALPSDKTWAR
jgi:hypothetical protein